MKHRMKNIPDEDINKILLNAEASLAIEGLKVTGEETEAIRKYLEGQYTEKETLRIIKNS